MTAPWRELFDRVADGIQSEADERELAAALETSAAARREYRAFMELHSALHWDSTCLAQPPARSVLCLDDAAAAATASPAPSRPESPPTSPPPRDQDVNRPSADSALGEARPSVSSAAREARSKSAVFSGSFRSSS